MMHWTCTGQDEAREILQGLWSTVCLMIFWSSDGRFFLFGACLRHLDWYKNSADRSSDQTTLCLCRRPAMGENHGAYLAAFVSQAQRRKWASCSSWSMCVLTRAADVSCQLAALSLSRPPILALEEVRAVAHIVSTSTCVLYY